MTEPIFLTLADVLKIHNKQLDAHGGIHGIRDEGLLESAVMTPQASFGGEYLHSDIFEMAAAYAFHIAENQPFLDGNKRTALVAALAFLDLNGSVIVDPERKLYSMLIDIANRAADKSDLADLLRSLPTE
ncbi:MAG: type II toxin-antitoxin system death-on-curing family toxin [Acidobacteria bacterium]|nr:type II toxin-antitoxin system death-on-curing family toxin [Acidobacteriota bacterium]